jgi:hypothetical protein
VIQPDSSDARNSAAAATSSGVPSRRTGCWPTSSSCCAAGMRSRFRSVRIVSGAMQFTRTPAAPAWAPAELLRLGERELVALRRALDKLAG